MSTTIADWVDIMADEVSVEPFLSLDAYGKPTYGALLSYPARVDFKNHMVTTAGAEQRVSSAIAIIARNTKVGTRDRVTLSDGSQPSILVSALIWDEQSPLYVRLDLQ